MPVFARLFLVMGFSFEGSKLIFTLYEIFMRLISRIKYVLGVPGLLLTVISSISRQKKFIAKIIDPEIKKATAFNDGSLDEADIKKLKTYYGLAVPAILGKAFCALRGSGMTEAERLASTCQGAMTGLGDDFFDRQRLSDQGVKDFIEKPEQFTGNTGSERLFLHFYKTALANAPQPELVKHQIVRVFHAQLLSKQQDSPGLSYDVIKDISISKGAESLLYYRTVFEHPLKEREEKMLYSLGGLMQVSNDIFDLYKDYKDGVHTLATTTNKINNLRIYYQAVLRLGIQAAFRSGYPDVYVRKFLGVLSIGIFCRCLVCLDQLEKNEKKSEGVFDLARYSRKDLICDMDTAGNKLKSLRYHLKISRQFR